jgi:hypothetical protein
MRTWHNLESNDFIEPNDGSSAVRRKRGTTDPGAYDGRKRLRLKDGLLGHICTCVLHSTYGLFSRM